MKVRSSVKPMCEKCKVIKRKGSASVPVWGIRGNTLGCFPLRGCADRSYRSASENLFLQADV